MNKEIEKLRKEIDSVDDELLKILSKRIKLSDEIILLKKSQGLTLEDIPREKDIVGSLTEKNPDVDKEFLEKLYHVIFSNAKSKHI